MENENDQPKPIASSLANILGKAMASSVKFDQQRPAVETRKCGGCGAARPEGTDLSACDFCGFEFFKKASP